jgi:predicted acetyltransferase
MAESQDIALAVATSDDVELLSNLLESYARELSDVFALKPGPDGRYGYDKLPLYWSEADRRFPFLLRRGGEVAGFALITRGSPASEDHGVFDMAEFFVLGSYRRCGVGRHAALLLWDRFPANWTVRVSEGNPGGCRFWARVIGEYTNGAVRRTLLPGRLHAWRVFSFSSAPRDAGPRA